jgi:NAD+ diphosphatase
LYLVRSLCEVAAMNDVNFYVIETLDRASARRRDSDWFARQLADPKSRLMPVWRGQNLLREGEEPEAAFLSRQEAESLLAGTADIALLGLIGDTAHFAFDLSHREEPPSLPGLRFADLRSVGPIIERSQGGLLAYARGLIYWHQRHRFCGVCGSPTESREAGHMRRCTNPACAAELAGAVDDDASDCMMGLEGGLGEAVSELFNIVCNASLASPFPGSSKSAAW